MNAKTIFRLGTLLITLLLVLLAGPVAAQGPQLILNVAPSDSPLIIHAQLGETPGTFSGNIRLTVSGGDAEEVTLLPYDLQHDADPEIKIDRTHISIPAGLALTENQPRDITVTIDQVEQPGLYTGELRFMLPGQAEADGKLVKIELHVKATPAVTALYPTESLELVRCYSPFDCWLAAIILPDSVTRDDFSVFLDNTTDADVEIESAIVILKGERTASTGASASLAPGVPLTLKANRVGELPVTITRSRIAPDSYAGSLRLSLKDSDTPLPITLNLDVRDGPFWALLVILLGMWAGRMARGLESPLGRMQVALMQTYNALVSKLEQVTGEGRPILTEKLHAWKKDLNAGRKAQALLESEIAEVEQRIDLVVVLQNLAAQLDDPRKAALKGQLAGDMEKARHEALIGSLETASALSAEMAVKIKEWTGGRMGSGQPRDFPLEDLLSTFDGAIKKAKKHLEHKDKSAPGPRISPLERLLAWVSGVQTSAEARFWIVRPLVFLLTAILLALLGLQTLYVNAGATFGVAGLYDYLGLFFWGIGTDVASRGLLSLTANPKPEEGG